MTIKLDRPMSPSEFEAMQRMDWHGTLRADVNAMIAKATQRQFDRRFTRQSGSEVVVEFPRVG